MNGVTSYPMQNQKPNMHLREKQLQKGVTPDRVQTLKHDISTRWHSRLRALSTFLSLYDDIRSFAEELKVPSSRLPKLSVDELETVAEFIIVLQEVRRVASKLEADGEITMS